MFPAGFKETACSSSFAGERLNGELSRVCNVLIVHHHPSNSMRISRKAHQRIFLPKEPAGSSELHNQFLGLVIKSMFTSSIPVCLGSKPCYVAAQWAASWRKGQARLSSRLLLLCFMKNFHLRDSTDPLRAKQTTTPEQFAQVLVCLPPSGTDSLPTTSGPYGAVILLLELFSISSLLVVCFHTSLPSA